MRRRTTVLALLVVISACSQRPAARPSPPPAAPSSASDVVAALNSARVSRGLRPLLHAQDLDAVSAANDVDQLSDGLGHYVTGDHAQVAARAEATDAAGVVALWIGSPRHNAIILDPSWTRVGASHTPPYWTATFE